MAVRIARVGREKTLATLAARVFEIEGPDKVRDLKRAETALLLANPQLADRSGFEAGAVVGIPADTGLKLTDRVEFAARVPESDLTEATRRLELGAKTVKEKFVIADRRSEKDLALLDDKDFRTALRSASKGSAKLANNLKKDLVARKAADQAKGAAFDDAMSSALTEVDRLSEMLKAATGKKD